MRANQSTTPSDLSAFFRERADVEQRDIRIERRCDLPQTPDRKERITVGANYQSHAGATHGGTINRLALGPNHALVADVTYDADDLEGPLRVV